MLLNAYGPTECSDDVTHFVVGTADPGRARLPIGGPVANTALDVLREDEGRWTACDVGEAGELFVGGVGVGRGYLGDPERTRAAFFRDRFADTPTGRIYRTGDAVTLLPEGVFEYGGRVDRQVKIAGVRMEPEEIEAALRTHPDVTACAVVLRRADDQGRLVGRETRLGGADTHRLVAYVCSDRAALAELVKRTQSPQPVRRYQPADTTEEIVVRCWTDVLGVPPEHATQGFFEAGGHSLLAVRLTNRLNAVAGSQVPLRSVLDAPSLRRPKGGKAGRDRRRHHRPQHPRILRRAGVEYFLVRGVRPRTPLRWRAGRLHPGEPRVLGPRG
ncbi:hypothetical protein NORO109296_23315 [Nocardiopsis rhodophaea]